MIENHHDDPRNRYPGVTKIIELIRRKCDALGLKAHVTKYIKECISYQQNKSARHRPYGEIQFAHVPKTP